MKRTIVIALVAVLSSVSMSFAGGGGGWHGGGGHGGGWHGGGSGWHGGGGGWHGGGGGWHGGYYGGGGWRGGYYGGGGWYGYNNFARNYAWANFAASVVGLGVYGGYPYYYGGYPYYGGYYNAPYYAPTVVTAPVAVAPPSYGSSYQESGYDYKSKYYADPNQAVQPSAQMIIEAYKQGLKDARNPK